MAKKIFSDDLKGKIEAPKFVDTKSFTDIDPFSFFGLFNDQRFVNRRDEEEGRRIRTAIAMVIGKELGLTESAPTTFDGIPTLYSGKPCFYRREHSTEDIPVLWSFFTCALEHARNPQDGKNLAEFKSLFEKVGTWKEPGGNSEDEKKLYPINYPGKISEALFWICPTSFFSIDKKTLKYIKSKDGPIPRDIAKLVSKTKTGLSAADYLNIVNRMKVFLENRTDSPKNFVEFSWAAEKDSNETDGTASQTKKSSKDNNHVNETKTPPPSPLPPKGADGKPLPRNLVWFGAPGTGKSHDAKAKIGEYFANAKETDDSIRTTFHPDSDYASFVGSYKPTMADCGHSRPRKQLSLDELALKLKSEVDAAGAGKEKTKILAVDLFGEEYSDILRDVSSLDLLNKAGLKASYSHNLDDSIKVGNYRAIHPDHPEKRIVYSFVPQAFTKAYVKAWEKMAKNPQSPERQFLVIEEINRGNCAQIFGDLFQLLDRDTVGYSKYPIDPDADLGQYLGEWFPDNGVTKDNTSERLPFEDTKETTTWGDVLSGRKLVLPPNLYIWATMNTSDQSLFPMDSAFKRRWEWKYSKIRNEDNNYKIISDEFDWWEFLQRINSIIRDVTSSADKQLGYFFVKLPDDLPEDKRIIDAETFVNKVIFYLWNDVFRDCELDADAFMMPNKVEKDSENNTNSKRQLTFDDFFDDNGEVNDVVVRGFLEKLLEKNTENNGAGETSPNQGEVPVSGSVSPGATTPEQ